MKSMLTFTRFLKESTKPSDGKIDDAMDIFQDFIDEYHPTYRKCNPDQTIEFLYPIKDTLRFYERGIFWTDLKRTFSDGESCILFGVGIYTLHSLLDHKEEWDKSREVISFIQDLLERMESLGLYTGMKGAEYQEGRYGAGSYFCHIIFGVFESKEKLRRMNLDELEEDNAYFLGRTWKEEIGGYEW